MKTPASDRTLELRGLLQRLTILTNDLDGDITLEEVISVGRELWRLISAMTHAMEMCKERVRMEAGASPGHRTMHGHDRSICTVVNPEPIPVLRSGVDLLSISREIGERTFNQLFMQRVMTKPRPEFTTEVVKLDPEQAKIALDAVDTVAGKSRVSFDKRS